MKENGSVTLTIHGEEMSFSEQELVAILEDRFPKKTRNPVIPEPTEDQWFEVKPLEIDQSLFEEAREDYEQEQARKLILKAFEEVEKNPQKYGGKFETMMPKKTWGGSKLIDELQLLACQLGDNMADWVEQALEWAQRIYNGETWEDVCNFPDTANCFRIIQWEDGYFRIVGNSRLSHRGYPPADVSDDVQKPIDIVNYSVPLVVRYKK